MGTSLNRGDGLMSHSVEANDTRLLNTSEMIDKHQYFESFGMEEESI